MTEPITVRVPVAGAAYDVVIGPGLMAAVGEQVHAVSSARKVAIVTDENVAGLYGIEVSRRLIAAGFDARPLTVPAGEQSKSWEHAGAVLEALAELRLDRSDLVVALGGGVVGDLAGFAAATYLRGIEFVQVPTTLLAQVDSSVGGKTGVDLKAGKNLAGAFKQPLLVIADTYALSSLPEEEWGSGLAEIAKSAVVDGEDFMGWLEDNAKGLSERVESAVIEAVRRSVEFKSRVVSADEKEAGLRVCLNYGHTFGHALEKVAGFGRYTHGVAVAEGMRFAARLAVDVVSADPGLVRRQDALLDLLGLRAISEGFEPSELIDAMHSDKKSQAGEVRFVLPTEVGMWECRAVDETMIREHVTAWAASKRGAE